MAIFFTSDKSEHELLIKLFDFGIKLKYRYCSREFEPVVSRNQIDRLFDGSEPRYGFIYTITWDYDIIDWESWKTEYFPIEYLNIDSDSFKWVKIDGINHLQDMVNLEGFPVRYIFRKCPKMIPLTMDDIETNVPIKSINSGVKVSISEIEPNFIVLSTRGWEEISWKKLQDGYLRKVDGEWIRCEKEES